MLAIIIPYYKLIFFEETLESLSNQTDKRFKVYIGDDASPENPMVLLDKYKGKFDYEYHRFENNLGSISLTQQWERCIALSGNEEWIMVLGDDDVLGKKVVEEFYINLKEIEINEINIVRFSTQIIDEISNIISNVFINDKFERASDFYLKKKTGIARSSLSEHIFRKKIYLKYLFKNYPIAWYSDDYAWVEFAENKPVFSINDEVISIRISNQSLTGNRNNLKEKMISESMFYMDLVKYNLNLFNRNIRFQILIHAEVTIKRYRKLSLEEWYVLFLKYISNFSFIFFLKLIRRFFKSFL